MRLPAVKKLLAYGASVLKRSELTVWITVWTLSLSGQTWAIACRKKSPFTPLVNESRIPFSLPDESLALPWASRNLPLMVSTRFLNGCLVDSSLTSLPSLSRIPASSSAPIDLLSSFWFSTLSSLFRFQRWKLRTPTRLAAFFMVLPKKDATRLL